MCALLSMSPKGKLIGDAIASTKEPWLNAGKSKRGRKIELNNFMLKMFAMIHALAIRESGSVDMVEFALAIALIAIATTAAMGHLGVGFSSMILKVSSTYFPTS